MERRAGGKLSVDAVVLLGSSLTTTTARAFGFDLTRDLRHRNAAVDRLAAGHRDGVVIENLVGDVGPAATAWRIARMPEWK